MPTSTSSGTPKPGVTGPTAPSDLVLCGDGTMRQITPAIMSAAGSASAASYLRGDNTWTTYPVIDCAAPTGVAATDIANINAAITSAATFFSGVARIQLRAGTYVVPAPATTSLGCVNVSVNHCELFGQGMGVTTIQLAPGSTGVTGIVRTPSGVQNNHITFRDFTIDGNAAGQTSSPVVIGFFCGVTPNSTQTDTDIRVINVEVMNCTGYGFDPHERTTRLLMQGCISHDNGSDGAHDGFTLDGCYDSRIIDCVSYNNGRHGINLVTASNRVTVKGNECYSNGGAGIVLQNGAKNCLITNNLCNSNTAEGILVNGLPQTGQQDNAPGTNNKVTGNLILLSGTHGIHLVGASGNHISGNTVRDSSQTTTNTSNQIYLNESGTTYSTFNTVIDNDLNVTSGVTNAPKYGITEKTSNEDNNFVTNNRSQGAVTTDLHLLGATSLRLSAHNGVNEHPATSPYSWDVPANHGWLEWNYPTDCTGSGTGQVLTSGTIYGCRVDIQSGAQISNVLVVVGTAGNTLTSGQNLIVLIDGTTGVELGRTGDQSTAWLSTGLVTCALVTPFTPAAGTHVAALIMSNGSTPVALVRGAATGVTTANGGLTSASPRRFFTAGTAQTAITTPITMSGTTATGAFTFWVALN